MCVCVCMKVCVCIACVCVCPDATIPITTTAPTTTTTTTTIPITITITITITHARTHARTTPDTTVRASHTTPATQSTNTCQWQLHNSNEQLRKLETLVPVGIFQLQRQIRQLHWRPYQRYGGYRLSDISVTQSVAAVSVTWPPVKLAYLPL